VELGEEEEEWNLQRQGPGEPFTMSFVFLVLALDTVSLQQLEKDGGGDFL
jgi:hypothetical protein